MGKKVSLVGEAHGNIGAFLGGRGGGKTVRQRLEMINTITNHEKECGGTVLAQRKKVEKENHRTIVDHECDKCHWILQEIRPESISKKSTPEA